MRDARIPPHDEQVEACILGAVLIDKDAISEVVDFIRPAYFYKDHHSTVYSAIMSLYERHEPVDIVTVTAELKKMGKYKEIGGTAFLTDLSNLVPTAANIEMYCRIVTDHYIRRRLIAGAAEIEENAFEEKRDAKDILDRAETEVFSIAQQRIRRDFIPVKDALAESFDRLDELQKRGSALRGIPS